MAIQTIIDKHLLAAGIIVIKSLLESVGTLVLVENYGL
jgi:hypothetical protein